MKFSKEEVKKFKGIVAKARKAANEAGANIVPTPMVVGTAIGFTNRIIPDTEQVVNEGMCGYACLEFNARGKFASWLKQEKLASKGVYKGLHMTSYTIYNYLGQSYERKTAAVYAAANVFQSYGIKCYAESRLDQMNYLTLISWIAGLVAFWFDPTIGMILWAYPAGFGAGTAVIDLLDL